MSTSCLTVSQTIDLFLVACQADGLRDATVQTYLDKLKPLRRAFGEFALASITTDNLRSHFADLSSQTQRWQNHPCVPPKPGGYAPATLYSFFRTVRRFFNWCVQDNLLEKSPVRGIKQKPVRKRVPRGISTEAFTSLLRATGGETVWKLRDRAIVLLLGDTGCRAGGAVNLNVADVNLDEGFVLLTEKGDQQRFSPISPITRDALAEYLNFRTSVLRDTDEEALFVSQRTRSRLTVSGMHQRVDCLGKRAGVRENVALHRIRHAFARWYLLNGGDLSTLSDLMGHSTVEVTREFYAIFNREELRRKHAQHSMVARLSRERDSCGGEIGYAVADRGLAQTA